MKNLIILFSLLLGLTACSKDDEIKPQTSSMALDGQYGIVLVEEFTDSSVSGYYISGSYVPEMSNNCFLHYQNGVLQNIVNLVNPNPICQTAAEMDSSILSYWGVSPVIQYFPTQDSLIFEVHNDNIAPPAKSGYRYYFIKTNYAPADSASCL